MIRQVLRLAIYTLGNPGRGWAGWSEKRERAGSGVETNPPEKRGKM